MSVWPSTEHHDSIQDSRIIAFSKTTDSSETNEQPPMVQTACPMAQTCEQMQMKSTKENSSSPLKYIGRVFAASRVGMCIKKIISTLGMYRIIGICIFYVAASSLYREKDLQDFSASPLSLGGTSYYYEETRPMNSRAVLPTMDFGKPIKIDGKHQPVKFLAGIMSTNREKDIRKREIIRKSYLSVYKDHPDTPHRICALNDYVNDKILQDECEFIYSFVVGGATEPNAPKQLVDDYDPLRPLTIDPPSDSQETDLTYINVKENGLEGKTHTYFKWASKMVREGRFHVDYIAKIDMDTMLFPTRWFSFVGGSLFPYPFNRRVYGGMLLDRLSCGGLRKWHCRQTVNKNYMAGELYFLSPDLADFITSDALDRKSMTFKITEDFSTGNYVHSSPQPINQFVISPKHVLWEHGDQLKSYEDYERRWAQLQHSWQNKPSKPFVGGETYEDFQKDKRTARSLTDEVYRRYPWRWLPDFSTRVNLP